ncbi:MAG: hypothetical protein ACREV5_23495 [Steroidobacter sp.]
METSAKFSWIAVGLLTLSFSHATHAIPIKWRLDSFVTENFGETRPPHPEQGDRVTAFIRFDSEGLPEPQVFPGLARYEFASRPFGMEVIVAGVKHRLERQTYIWTSTALSGESTRNALIDS